VRVIGVGLTALIALGIIIQLVPYGREHDNPDIRNEPNWDQARTRELFFRACKDCHSNQTEWPAYSFVAPMSWLVQRDVEEGRSHFNISEWGRDKNHGDDAAKMVRESEMPPWFYLPAHSEARLSDAEREEFVAGLIATFGEKTEHGGGHGHDADSDH